MRVLINTDVLLDVALQRDEFVESSSAVFRWIEAGGKAAIAWHSISNCAYILENDGRDFLRPLMTIVQVAKVGHKEALRALDLPMPDLEDAMQVVSAQSFEADVIITRNLKDYKLSPLRAVSPVQFLKLIYG